MGFNEELQLGWDDEKSLLCKKRRGYSLEEVAIGIFSAPYAEYTVAAYPDQFRAVGKYRDCFFTLAYEDVDDELGQYSHLITYWKSESLEIDYYYKQDAK